MGKRITPACAGISQSNSHPFYIKKDHPRVRGDKTLILGAEKYQKGSPPRARG